MVEHKMQIITINVPEKYVEALDALAFEGFYPSRSECLRIMLREFVKNEVKFFREVDRKIEKIKNEPETINLGGRVLTIGRRSQ